VLEGRELMRGVSSLMARAQLRNGGQRLVHPRWAASFWFRLLRPREVAAGVGREILVALAFVVLLHLVNRVTLEVIRGVEKPGAL
jgi:hypothetical protein